MSPVHNSKIIFLFLKKINKIKYWLSGVVALSGTTSTWRDIVRVSRIVDIGTITGKKKIVGKHIVVEKNNLLFFRDKKYKIVEIKIVE